MIVIRKNAREELRVAPFRQDGRDFVSIRLWARRDDGTFTAARQKILLRLDLVGALVEAIQEVNRGADDSAQQPNAEMM